MRLPILLAAIMALTVFEAFAQVKPNNVLNHKKIAVKHFGNDHQWYQDNIPFFECSDKDLENVYYYRWQLFKSHFKNLGKEGYIVTEFLNAMNWDLKPYNSLNDATVFHIYEGRWLRDRVYMNDYINFMYKKGGNDRHFSEAIADAAYAYYLVNPDIKFITSLLPDMIRVYNAWDDHYDSSKKLYYVEPINDATEYTISSINASGGKDGFKGGHSFRPSINSYMYANAKAIKNIALLNKDVTTANSYEEKADAIKKQLQEDLWNRELRHFTDRYKADNDFVKYWDFIRGRELVGFVPWTYQIPDNNDIFNSAWQHLMDTTKFNGKYGLRTVEPSYAYYMKQYRYDKATGLKECQWNGPSWPYQTTQVLMAMANILNNYKQNYIGNTDYVDVLRKYARQHYKGDSLNLLENYDPDKGGYIVNIDERSEHYNHSGYNNLIITGFCGLRPGANNVLTINPLITADIEYFCLENVFYQGHNITILFDKSGKRYNKGSGITVYLNGKKIEKSANNTYQLPEPIGVSAATPPRNIAVNVSGKSFPKASASYTYTPDQLNMAIDGRIWNFTDVRNRWSCYGTKNKFDWYAIEFEKPEQVKAVRLFFYNDGKNFKAPKKITLEYLNNGNWQPIEMISKTYRKPGGNTTNFISLKPVITNRVRVIFKNPSQKGNYTALSEVEIY